MTARIPDINGFYEVSRNPLSKAGVFPYTKKSVGYPGWENDPGGIVQVYRPAEELGNPETVKSFRLLPWVDDHAMLGNPEEDASLTPPEKKGIHGTIGEQVFFNPDDETLYGNIKLWSSSLADAVDAGKKELSMGFRCVYEFVAGIFKGQEYQAVQRTIRGNHQASVQHGRMGPGVAVLDHFSFALDASELREVTPMATKTTRRVNLSAKLGVSPTALAAAVGMDSADAATLAAWNKTMDAEEDPPADEGEGKAEMTLSEITSVITEAAKPLGELQAALADIAGAGAGSVEDPDMALGDEEMEPMMDEFGAAKKNPDGTPMMQKKAAPAADALGKAPTLGIAAADAAIAAMDSQAATMRKMLKGRACDAMVAFDASIAKVKTARIAAVKKLTPKTVKGKGMDTNEVKAALDGLATAVKAVPTTKSLMGEIASRDKLANRVSAFTGTFDHAEMTTVDVAVYAATKFGLDAKPETAVASVEAYLHNRQPGVTGKPLSGFGMDEAPPANKYISDFVAGRPAAAV